MILRLNGLKKLHTSHSRSLSAQVYERVSDVLSVAETESAKEDRALDARKQALKSHLDALDKGLGAGLFNVPKETPGH